jgi:hypothetical protein
MLYKFSFDCQSIIYLFRNVSSSSIEEKLRIMRYCHDLSERRKDISFNDEDKFCYTKLALTKLLVFMSRRSDFIPEPMFLSMEQLVVTYSKYLCEVGFDHSPEPYLFFLMLNWYLSNKKISFLSSNYKSKFAKCKIPLVIVR